MSLRHLSPRKGASYVAAAGARGAGGAGGGRAGRGAAAAAAAGALAHGDGGRAARLVALGGNNLVVVAAERQARALPGGEVVGHGDGAARPLVDADGPVLVEGRRALDRRLVDALRAVDVVHGSIRCHAAELGRPCRRVVRAKVLNHVVLDQRALSPAVHGQVRVSVGAVRARVGDAPVLL